MLGDDPSYNKANNDNIQQAVPTATATASYGQNVNIPVAEVTYAQAVPMAQVDMNRAGIPAQQTTTTNVVYVETVTPELVMLPSRPIPLNCPNCKQRIVTRVTRQPGAVALCSGLAICLVCWPLFWVPCVVPECLDSTHVCPNCGAVIGVKPAC